MRVLCYLGFFCLFVPFLIFSRIKFNYQNWTVNLEQGILMLAGKGISTCPLCTDPNKDTALVFILQIRMFYHWNVEIPDRFYFQNKYLKVLLLSHPLLQALSLQSFCDSAHSGLIYEQECGICRCPWSGTHWTVRVRDVSEECLGLTSSVFADGYTNTEGASAIFRRKGESKYILNEKKQLFKLKPY